GEVSVYRATDIKAGLLDLSLSFVAEIIAFIAMILVLARWVYPRVMAAAEARQRAVAEQLMAAEKAREQSEQRLREAEAKLDEARRQASDIIEGANRMARWRCGPRGWRGWRPSSRPRSCAGSSRTRPSAWSSGRRRSPSCSVTRRTTRP